MRAGISRTLAEVLVLVGAVILIMMMVPGIRSYIFSGLRNALSHGAPYQVKILGVKPSEEIPSYPWVSPDLRGVPSLAVVLKNPGPRTIPNCVYGPNWTVSVKNSSGIFISMPAYIDCIANCGLVTEFEPEEVWVLYIPELVQSGRERLVVSVYGPEGARDSFIYYPP